MYIARIAAVPLMLAVYGVVQPARAAMDVEEIIVSARLRDVAVSQVPASLTILDADEIRQTAVQHFEELPRLVPNMNWSGEGNRARYFQLRGIGELEQYEGAPNPSVGFIVDDIDFSALGGVATSFDTARVEVLRGPQGSRYGANALAGLVLVRTAEPTAEAEAIVEATAGNDDTWAVGAAGGGPVPGTGERLLYRLAAQNYEGNGFRDNAFSASDDTYGRDELTLRGKLRWLPSEDWRADLTAFYADLDNGYDAFAIDNGFTTYSDKPGRDAQQTLAGSLRIEGKLNPAINLVSITGGAANEIDFSFDADWGNDNFWSPFIYDFFQSFPRERDTLNQEIRLGSTPAGRLFGDRVDWVIGVYGLRLDEQLERRDFGRDDFFCIDPCESRFTSDYEATNLAVFGEVDMRLGSATRLLLGLRREIRDADYTDSNQETFAPTDRMVGGELGITHEIGERTSVYARLARGYKAGGFNLDPNVDPADIEFDPEFLWNYEIGARLSGARDRWGVDLSAFWQERDDMQVKIPVQDELGNPIAFSFFTENAESGRNIGVELAGHWQLTQPLRLHATVGLLDTELSEFSYDPASEGRDQAHAPAYTFSLGGTYHWPSDWFLRLDVSGRDEFFFDYGHDQMSDAYATLDFRFGKLWDHWSVTAWGRNLLDEQYAVRGFFFGNEPPDFPEKLYIRLGDPRHFGLTVRYRY